MNNTPLINVDLLINAIKIKTHKVVMARMNPKDMEIYPVANFRLLIGGSEILPSSEVERGMLVVDTQQLR